MHQIDWHVQICFCFGDNLCHTELQHPALQDIKSHNTTSPRLNLLHCNRSQNLHQSIRYGTLMFAGWRLPYLAAKCCSSSQNAIEFRGCSKVQKATAVAAMRRRTKSPRIPRHVFSLATTVLYHRTQYSRIFGTMRWTRRTCPNLIGLNAAHCAKNAHKPFPCPAIVQILTPFSNLI